MISIRDLVKTYGDVRAVDGVSMEVAAGEIVGLVGPNGAGKTSILRCIAGIIPPTEGSVALGGFDLAADPVQAKMGLAFIPDEPHLFDHLTSWDFLMLTARLYKVENTEAKASELLERFHLEERRLSFPGELSRGMKQKLVISAALLHDPKVLILDEPLTGLDPRAMRQMKDTITQVATTGTSVLVSSHMLQLVEEISARVVVLHKGNIVLQGTLDEIRSGAGGLGEEADLESIFLHATEEPDPA